MHARPRKRDKQSEREKERKRERERVNFTPHDDPIKRDIGRARTEIARRRLVGGDDGAWAAINKPAHARRAGRRVYPPFMRVDFVVSVCAGTSQAARHSQRTRRTVRGATVINSRATRGEHDASALAVRVHCDVSRSGSGDGDGDGGDGGDGSGGGGSGGGGGGDGDSNGNGSLLEHAPRLVPETTMILGHGPPT